MEILMWLSLHVTLIFISKERGYTDAHTEKYVQMLTNIRPKQTWNILTVWFVHPVTVTVYLTKGITKCLLGVYYSISRDGGLEYFWNKYFETDSSWNK